MSVKEIEVLQTGSRPPIGFDEEWQVEISGPGIDKNNFKIKYFTDVHIHDKVRANMAKCKFRQVSFVFGRSTASLYDRNHRFTAREFL